MFGRARCLCAAIIFWSVPSIASTVSMTYELTPLGGNVYRYDYSVDNNGSLGAGVPIELFDIFFNPALYDEASLTVATPSPLSTQWSETFLGSLPGIPAAYDALALSGGIPDGSTVSGFAVQFTWLGNGTPGSQPFSIYSANFDLLQNGTTAPGNTVPEPSFVWALGIALASAALVRHWRLCKTAAAEHVCCGAGRQ